jgi:exonuclease III
MNPRLISWNVKGLNQGGKRLKIINLSQWKADIICLQETKLELIFDSIVRSLWGCQFLDWCCLPSSGASGGILLMWDKRVMEKIEVCVGEYVVACSFRNIEDKNLTWGFAGVYGPNLDSHQRSLWDELAGLLSWWDLHWCIGGDFNVIHFPCERLGVTHLSPAMMEFFDFISEQGLMDLPLVGGVVHVVQ